MSEFMADDEVMPEPGKPCSKCKRPTGVWIKTYSEKIGSYWAVTCESCGNQMSRMRIMPGEFLDTVKEVMGKIKGDCE